MMAFRRLKVIVFGIEQALILCSYLYELVQRSVGATILSTALGSAIVNTVGCSGGKRVSEYLVVAEDVVAFIAGYPGATAHAGL